MMEDFLTEGLFTRDRRTKTSPRSLVVRIELSAPKFVASYESGKSVREPVQVSSSRQRRFAYGVLLRDTKYCTKV
jgi:hypothetical protein